MSQQISKTIPKLIAAVCTVMLVLMLSVTPAAAEESAVPELPMQIYGTVVDDTTHTDLPVGKVVKAYVGNDDVGSFSISVAGKIGGPGLWDDKFLIQSKNIADGDEISFEVDGVKVLQKLTYRPGESASVNLAKPGDEPSPMVSAAENAASVRKVETPAAIETLPIPYYTNPKSGKSIQLDEGVVVTAVINGVPTELPATIENGKVKLAGEVPAGAADIKVEFVGLKLGDSDGDGKVTVNDAVKVAQSLVNIVTLNEKGKFYGDPDGDGKVTVNDAVKVAQRLVDLVDENYE